MKDVTVKQVTLNVRKLTHMNKINIVSSQAVLKMSSFSMDTRSMSRCLPHHWSTASSKSTVQDHIRHR